MANGENTQVIQYFDDLSTKTETLGESRVLLYINTVRTLCRLCVADFTDLFNVGYQSNYESVAECDRGEINRGRDRRSESIGHCECQSCCW